MTSIDETFGLSVAVVRGIKKMSQRALGDALASRGFPIDAPAVSRIESGNRSVRLSEAALIADVLEIDLGALTSGGSQEELEARMAQWDELEQLRKFKSRILAATRSDDVTE